MAKLNWFFSKLNYILSLLKQLMGSCIKEQEKLLTLYSFVSKQGIWPHTFLSAIVQIFIIPNIKPAELLLKYFKQNIWRKTNYLLDPFHTKRTFTLDTSWVSSACLNFSAAHWGITPPLHHWAAWIPGQISIQPQLNNNITFIDLDPNIPNWLYRKMDIQKVD